MPNRKTAEPVAVEEDTYDAQPGQLSVRNTTDHVLFLTDLTQRRSYTEQPAYVLRPGVATLVPNYLFGRRSEGRGFIDNGDLEILRDRGAIAELIDLQSVHDRVMARDGHGVLPVRAQWVDHWAGVVVDRSLAECIVNCIDAGIPEDDCVPVLVRVYDESFARQTATQQPWIAASQQLIAQHNNGGGDTE